MCELSCIVWCGIELMCLVARCVGCAVSGRRTSLVHALCQGVTFDASLVPAWLARDLMAGPIVAPACRALLHHA